MTTIDFNSLTPKEVKDALATLTKIDETNRTIEKQIAIVEDKSSVTREQLRDYFVTPVRVELESKVSNLQTKINELEFELSSLRKPKPSPSGRKHRAETYESPKPTGRFVYSHSSKGELTSKETTNHHRALEKADKEFYDLLKQDGKSFKDLRFKETTTSAVNRLVAEHKSEG